MNIVEIKIEALQPYEKNPRKNDEAVKYVAASIEQFGFKVPLVIDKNNVIVAGHTRYKAAKELGIDAVPCIIADDLTDEQIKAFRLADNKVSEKALWDFELLGAELDELTNFNMQDFGFVVEDMDIDWAGVEDLSEETYEEPQKDMLECPHCHHIDSKTHFKKVGGVEVAAEKVEEYEVKKAQLDDIDKIKQIADKYTKEIGFVLKPALEENCNKGTLVVAKQGERVLGFCNYNKRKADGVNVIYEICVDTRYRGNGIARKMINFLDRPIRLKCPVDNESNNFYAAIGFSHVDVEQGKKRQLNVWELE